VGRICVSPISARKAKQEGKKEEGTGGGLFSPGVQRGADFLRTQPHGGSIKEKTKGKEKGGGQGQISLWTKGAKNCEAGKRGGKFD